MSKLAGRRRPPVQALLAAGLLLLLISLGGAAGTVQAGTMCPYAGTRAVMDSLPAQMARCDLVSSTNQLSTPKRGSGANLHRNRSRFRGSEAFVAIARAGRTSAKANGS